MDTSVRVAVRIRPQLPREIKEMSGICTAVTPNEPQITLNGDRAFTYDYVFDTTTEQSAVYNTAVTQLVEESLKGYNVTVLAYGQTGSGKTYTMGTGFQDNTEIEGVVPRAVRHLFEGIDKIQGHSYNSNGANSSKFQYSVTGQFIEVYNNEIIDLLDPNQSKVHEIHEDMFGEIYVTGVTIKLLNSHEDAMSCLQQGLVSRSTGWTQINEKSSRSHALFTIMIRRQRIIPSNESGMDFDDLEIVTSKLHFVDLAGSERLKRSGATGERAKESIHINCGLFALGNVISALGDKSLKASHIPYRESKLTRLLQDSLGGNSQTLMIACISPCNRDMMETLSTLQYANRARNIRNHVEINQDQNSRLIASLRKQISALQSELSEYKKGKRCRDVEETISHLSSVLVEAVNSVNERKGALFNNEAIQYWCKAGNDKSATDLIMGMLEDIDKLQVCLAETNEKIKTALNELRNQTDSSFDRNDDTSESKSSESDDTGSDNSKEPKSSTPESSKWWCCRCPSNKGCE